MHLENKYAFFKTMFCSMVSLFLVQKSSDAQDFMSGGQVSGNIQVSAQYYMDDEQNKSQVPKQIMGFNSFGNIIYTNGNFSSGIRVESYEPSLLGYPASAVTPYQGTGIGYRFFKYANEKFSVTLGNFYEQFGNGYTFRAYEERNLGVDNAMDGISVRYVPYKGITLKGLYGKQRLGFSNGFTKGAGIVRAMDSEFALNDILDSLFQSKTRVTVGASFVSKYQEDTDPNLVLPENVGTYGARLNLNRGGYNFITEYAYKINDPSSDNGFIYKDGKSVMLTNTYSKKGIGITFSTQYIENMSFRSDRTGATTDLLINFVPALPRQHTYNLPATLFPYATQINGEVAFQGEIIYNIKKETLLGGKYGTTVSLNASFVKGLDKKPIEDKIVMFDSIPVIVTDMGEFGNREGYKASFYGLGGTTYFRDFHIEIAKKVNSKFKFNLMLANFIYDYDVLIKPGYGKFGTSMFILESNYKINKKNAIRTELQGLVMGNFFMSDSTGDFKIFDTDREFYEGHWATILVEYTYSPHWFVAVQNQYRFGNSHLSALHHPLISFGYTEGATRFMVTAGRQRQGLFCVGGVCRQVPASTGVSVTITSTF